MPSTLAYVVGKMYLCTIEIQESVHGSPCRFRLHYKKDQIESHLLAVGARAFSTVGQILAGSLSAGKYLFGYHVGICHLLVVNQVDTKCILQFRERIKGHILLTLKNLRHVLLSTVHAFSKGLLRQSLLLHLQQHLHGNLL